MKWFRKKTLRQAQGDKIHWTDKAAGKVAGAGIKVQTKFANAMNKLVSAMPGRQLKICLVVFCLFSGGFSFYLVAHAIFSADKVQPALEVKEINVPKHFNQTGSEINEPEIYVSEEMYREIQNYKRCMDSLGQVMRPGLQDSIRILEQIYHSQKIK